MAYTQADLDALDAQILAASSMQSMTHAQGSITLRPLDEMLKLRALMAQALSSATTPGNRLAATSKGV